MNDPKLTYIRRFQILLLVFFTFFLTVPGLAQGPNPAPPTEVSGSSPQRSSHSGKFAVFGDIGVAVPHGDFSAFTDPGLSVDAGLEYMITPQVSGNAKFYLVDESSRVRPFVNGGVGDYVTDSGTSHFGGNLGGGVLFEVTPRFGVQGKYNFNIFRTGGGNLRFSTVQGGVRWRF